MCVTEDKTMDGKYANKVSIETALEMAGYGKFNHFMTFVCSLSMMATIIELFGISFIVQASSCDLELTLEQRGILSGIPMGGVIVTAYAWGYLTDIKGRRTILFVSSFVGFVTSFLSSFAPDMLTLTILKFISVSFASASFSATYTYLGEFLPKSYRDRILTMLTCANALSELVIALIAYPLLTYLDFRYELPLIGVIFRPWRLLSIVLSLPMAACALCLLFTKESPKFLLINNKEEEAIAVLRKVYEWNTGLDQYPVRSLEMQKITKDECKVLFLKSLRQQCEPLFRKPLLKYTLMIYASLFLICFTTNGLSMWYPYIIDKFIKNLNSEHLIGETFCKVFNYNDSTEIVRSIETCDDSMSVITYVSIGGFAVGGAFFAMIIAFLLKIIGKKTAVMSVLLITSFSAFVLNWISNAVASLLIFIFFNYAFISMGIMPIFIVDIYPTHVRGMAGCLSIMVARLGSVLGIYLTGIIFETYCEGTIFAASGIILLCAILALLLPN